LEQNMNMRKEIHTEHENFFMVIVNFHG
jgi:hypothetical protein